MKLPSGSFEAFVRAPLKEKISLLFVVLIFTPVALLAVESLTSYFSLSKASGNLAILERIVELRSTSKLNEDEQIIITQILEQIKKVNNRTGFSIFSFSLERFLYGLVPWALFYLCFMRNIEDGRSAFFVVLIFALIYGSVAGFVQVESFFMKAIAVPWGLWLGSVTLLFFTVYAFYRPHKDQEKVGKKQD